MHTSTSQVNKSQAYSKATTSTSVNSGQGPKASLQAQHQTAGGHQSIREPNKSSSSTGVGMYTKDYLTSQQPQ